MYSTLEQDDISDDFILDMEESESDTEFSGDSDASPSHGRNTQEANTKRDILRGKLSGGKKRRQSPHQLFRYSPHKLTASTKKRAVLLDDDQEEQGQFKSYETVSRRKTRRRKVRTMSATVQHPG
ncbi:hypothetical protein PI124_g2480 [Phytophthora idaei]|nr:hypothetical protein PI125_g2092 [Phytophthora idaei]KAG3252914.1 hypothetical protein PI124_g2480 [Phytophthora idaei]